MASTDRDVLRVLYRSTNGPKWLHNTNWDTDADLSEWHGVDVNAQGCVEKLELPNNFLSGPIPPELGNLAALQQLNLSLNLLSGRIPPELGALGKMRELRLEGNNLTGEIPASLGNLHNLRRLTLLLPPGMKWGRHGRRLRDNKFTGLLPPPSFVYNREEVLRWVQRVQGRNEDVAHSYAFRAMRALTSLWHFLLPVLDDTTDLWLLWETFGGSQRGLWWTCLCVFVVADVERVYTTFFLVSFLFFVLLQFVLNVITCFEGIMDTCVCLPFLSFLAGQRVTLSSWHLFLDSLLWSLFGSRARSSPFMRTFGWAGDSSGQALQEAGLGLHAIDVMVYHHPFRFFGELVMSFPRGHRRADVAKLNVAHRRKISMVRAVGETLWVDSLFLALAAVTGEWDHSNIKGLALFSALFSVLELVTELQYYVAEAEDGKLLSNTTVGDVEVGAGGKQNVDLRPIDLVGPSHG